MASLFPARRTFRFRRFVPHAGYDSDVDTTGEPEATAHRPRPPRPDVAVAPLHVRAVDPGTAPQSLRAAVTTWALSFAAFAILAGALGIEYDAVVDALASGLGSRNPTADPTTVDQVAGLTVLGVGGVGLLLVLAAVLGIVRLRSGRGRVWLTAVAVLTVAGAVTAWSVLADAGDLTLHALTWAPLLQAGLAAVGTALLYTGAASGWLRQRGDAVR
ncbi:hypothetical protein A5N78_15360 [Prescottella equi]|nr:hypothetical protein [Prescottella equi]ORL33614.1 hypothetical protein A6I91_07680 [Prescottella equi]ORL87654.1 hypothetical protein A5N78_15360 [Prescottella equi]ORM13339.1 hypothetical protein A5N70_19620 [Prescottella equi]